MAQSEALRKIDFIENFLPKIIVERNEDFRGFEIVSCKAELNKHLDGFMSAIYDVKLTMKGPDDKKLVVIRQIERGCR